MTNDLIPIQNLIYEIRGHKVMLDSDLATLYGVTTFNLNKAVKRNIKRFPDDFMFQLTKDEWDALIFQNGISKHKRGGRRFMPYAFTEHGVAMLSSVLNSEQAINVNIQIMRSFAKLRNYALTQNNVNGQIAELRKLLMLHIENTDNKFSEHEQAIKQIVQALNNLIEQPRKPQKIGFYNE
ncbi:MAG: ORF6N domain-containing protein [Heliobacteriaceae bacterium]|jgi:phage regulator Rha-like protein|nr:ORF6N domain-containing protein [Heliobacteriaceae bacterium]